MSGLLWMGITLGAIAVLVATAIRLRAIGAPRWAELIRTRTSLLESGQVGVQDRLASPTRFDARELDGLPAPVHRYFRAVLTDGQPIVAAVTLEMSGTMNMSAAAEKWKPFESRQRGVTCKPGFLWDAQLDIFPGVHAHVEDSYIAGRGRLLAKVFWVVHRG